jgi:DNA-binding MarR family transcriptional regulator
MRIRRPVTMSPDQTKEKRQACYYILSYLLDNPDAGDTLEGIVEWWVLHQRIRFETQTVSQAVAKLVDDGFIVEQKGPDSRVIYRAKRTSENTRAILNEIRSLSHG